MVDAAPEDFLHRWVFEIKTSDADMLLAAESREHLHGWQSQIRDLCPSIKS